MGKPTEAEYESALTEAARMRESGEDPNFVAKTLLNLDYRFQHLEKVYEALEAWLHSGQSVQEHTRLMLLLDRYRNMDRVPGEEPDSPPL